MLPSMGLQRVGHDLVTEQQQLLQRLGLFMKNRKLQKIGGMPERPTMPETFLVLVLKIPHPRKPLRPS